MPVSVTRLWHSYMTTAALCAKLYRSNTKYTGIHLYMKAAVAPCNALSNRNYTLLEYNSTEIHYNMYTRVLYYVTAALCNALSNEKYSCI